MDMRFLRGDPQTPKGHAIFIARSTSDPRVVFCTYCIVPPTPLSLAKYLPSFLAAQLPAEELRDANNVNVIGVHGNVLCSKLPKPSFNTASEPSGNTPWYGSRLRTNELISSTNVPA